MVHFSLTLRLFRQPDGVNQCFFWSGKSTLLSYLVVLVVDFVSVLQLTDFKVSKTFVDLIQLCVEWVC